VFSGKGRVKRICPPFGGEKWGGKKKKEKEISAAMTAAGGEKGGKRGSEVANSGRKNQGLTMFFHEGKKNEPEVKRKRGGLCFGPATKKCRGSSTWGGKKWMKEKKISQRERG